MPSLGQTSDELKIVAWLKAEGERVEAGEPLLEVETDKATLTVESAASGMLLKILRAAGETVQAGSPLAYLGERGEALPESESPAPASIAPRPAPTPVVPPRPRTLATPAARQLARDHDVDLALVPGTGPGGAVQLADVEAYLGER